MTSNRPYRAAMRAEEATRELMANAGTQFDPAVVAALIEEIAERPSDAELPAAQ